MNPGDRIDPAERLRIERAVIEAELRTAGEIVVMVVGACDGYLGARWRAGVLLALLASSAWLYFGPWGDVAVVLAVQIAAVALGRALCRIDAVLRWFVPGSLLASRAAERAASAFREQGLGETEGRTGVLVFVALLEHRVVVLGDSGIDRVLDADERWESVVEAVLAGARRGALAEGILAGVERVGATLARHLPAGERNPDELPTALVLSER